MSRRRSRSNLSDEGGVDMTPMLDIVFILLIFFIVTAVFIDEKGVDLIQTQNDMPSTSDAPVISIVINSEDAISVEGRIVALALVEAEVQRHLIHRPNAAIDLRAAEDARLENVVTIKDRMEQAGRAVRFDTYIPTVTTAGLN